jgi:hypothetical protein
MALGSRVVLPAAAANLTLMPSIFEVTLHARSKQPLAECANRTLLSARASQRQTTTVTCVSGKRRSPPGSLAWRGDMPCAHESLGTLEVAIHC